MKIKRTQNSDTELELLIEAEPGELAKVKEHVLKDFAGSVKAAGFRQGKAPLTVVEKNIDQDALRREFIEHAVNQLYWEAVQQENIRPIGQPKIDIMKVAPFDVLEIKVVQTVLGQISVADYRNLKVTKPVPKEVTAEDINKVIDQLKLSIAERTEVKRPAKSGDQVWFDFNGDDKNGKQVNGASGKNYPLVLGSDSFIPEFEPNLVGLSAGDDKKFEIKFPKDYRVKALASKVVVFSVRIIKVDQITEPKVDVEFASRVGPFKTVDELKSDIKTRLTLENRQQNEMAYESEVLKRISDKSKLTLPSSLVEDEIERRFTDLKQNLVYRGETIAEFLSAEGKTEEEFKKTVLRPQAEEQVKASMILSEISQIEGIGVSNQEIADRIAAMRAQYSDPQSQTELDKEETKSSVASRILAEKTIRHIVSLVSS